MPQRVLTKVVRPAATIVSLKFVFGLELQRSWRGQWHTSSRSTTHHQAELNAFLDILLSADNLLHSPEQLVFGLRFKRDRAWLGGPENQEGNGMFWESCIVVVELTRPREVRETEGARTEDIMEGDWYDD